MKNLITIILLFVVANVTAQDLTLLHINAKWNQSNDYNLDRIRNVKVTMAKLEDQKPELKAQIKAVPTIILIGKDGRPKGQWQADLSFKINVPIEEIQKRVNFVLFESN